LASTQSATRSPTASARAGRRDAILSAAARLFSTRGYAETGIDDIGEAVGVTGPAVYRHFASKQDLLLAVLEQAIDHATQIVPRVRAEAKTPEEALRLLVELTVAACIEDRALTAIHWQEARNLPDGPRRRSERVQRQLIEEYAEILRGVRPELTPSEARMTVYAASALIRSVANRETSLDEETLQRLLSSMALAAMLAAEPH
jgi:AcrR family transcriptional regulator